LRCRSKPWSAAIARVCCFIVRRHACFIDPNNAFSAQLVYLFSIALNEFRLLSSYRKMQGFQPMFSDMAKALAARAVG
jgi:hypothetical protein